MHRHQRRLRFSFVKIAFMASSCPYILLPHLSFLLSFNQTLTKSFEYTMSSYSFSHDASSFWGTTSVLTLLKVWLPILWAHTVIMYLNIWSLPISRLSYLFHSAPSRSTVDAFSYLWRTQFNCHFLRQDFSDTLNNAFCFLIFKMEKYFEKYWHGLPFWFYVHNLLFHLPSYEHVEVGYGGVNW